MPQAQIVTHMAALLVEEGIEAEAAALQQLAKGAAGSMRDALSLLDQAIAHGAGRVTAAEVRDMLGTVGDDYLYQLLDALAAADVGAMLDLAEAMETRSLSFDSALQELATLIHRIALLQFAPQAIADLEERRKLAAYAAVFDAEYLQLAYQIAIQGRDDLGLAPDERAGFSMSLLRLHAFRPETPPALGLAISSAVPTVAPVAAPATVAAPASARVAQPLAKPAPAKRSARPPESAAAASDDWHSVTASLKLGGMARQLAQHCDLAEVGADEITLRLPPAHQHLRGKAHQDRLLAELQRHYGRELKLTIVLAEAAEETPAERSRQVQRQRQERAIAAIEQDGFVREVVEIFDATINEASIKPI